MKAVMIGLALFLVMGCGRSDAKKLSEELDARNKAWEAEVEALSNARPNEPTKPEQTKAIISAGTKLWEFETGDTVGSPPPSALMARFTSGLRTTSSMPSMARLGSSYGNLKREIMCTPPLP